jgi:hypothetical protein
LQVKKGGREVLAGAIKLPSDWYTRRDPIREPVFLRDISRSGALLNSVAGRKRRNSSRPPVVPVEICVLRIRSSRLHDGAAGVTNFAASSASCCMVQCRVLQGNPRVLGFANMRSIQSLGGPNGKVKRCWDSQCLYLSLLWYLKKEVVTARGHEFRKTTKRALASRFENFQVHSERQKKAVMTFIQLGRLD